MVSIIKEGLDLRDKALDVPFKIGGCIKLEPQKVKELYSTLHIILDRIK